MGGGFVPPPRPLARSGRFEGSFTDTSERTLASDATLDELEASRTFETFYQVEARTLFRRLWLDREPRRGGGS